MLIPYDGDYIDTDILDKQLTGAEKAYVEWLKAQMELNGVKIVKEE